MMKQDASAGVQTLEQFADELGGFVEFVAHGDHSPAMLDCAKPLRDAFARNFANSGNSETGGWPPRKPNPKDDGHPLLIDTGALQAAATGTGPGAVAQATANELLVGVDKDVNLGGIPGAGVHNYGFENIPQREFLVPDTQSLDECDEICADHLIGYWQ